MNLSGKAVQPILRQTVFCPRICWLFMMIWICPQAKSGSAQAEVLEGIKVFSLSSIIYSPGILRLRIGVERPPIGVDPAEYVLQSIPYEKRPLFDYLWNGPGDVALCRGSPGHRNRHEQVCSGWSGFVGGWLLEKRLLSGVCYRQPQVHLRICFAR